MRTAGDPAAFATAIKGAIEALQPGGPVIESLLFNVRPNDPVTFSAVGVVLAMIVCRAAAIPARRAARVDPMLALRSE